MKEEKTDKKKDRLEMGHFKWRGERENKQRWERSGTEEESKKKRTKKRRVKN